MLCLIYINVQKCSFTACKLRIWYRRVFLWPSTIPEGSQSSVFTKYRQLALPTASWILFTAVLRIFFFFLVLSSRLHANLSELLQTACSRHFISPITLILLRATRMSITLGSHYRQFPGYVICDLHKFGITAKKPTHCYYYFFSCGAAAQRGP